MAHVKTMDGAEVKVPSQGQVNLNTVLGAVGTYGALGGFNGCGGGILGNLFGGGNGLNRGSGCSCADALVTRYEMALVQENNAKDNKIALLEANIYNDQKSLELYRYVDGKFSEIQSALAAQAVTNTAFNSAMAAMDYKFTQQVALEAERRECADCKIVNYANSTFAPKLITDYGAGTTSATAQVYNPLACGCGCGQ